MVVIPAHITSGDTACALTTSRGSSTAIHARCSGKAREHAKGGDDSEELHLVG